MECTLEEAQRHLSEIIEIVAHGGRVTVTRGGVAIAQIEPCKHERKPFPFGLLSQVGAPPDEFFDEPLYILNPFWDKER